MKNNSKVGKSYPKPKIKRIKGIPEITIKDIQEMINYSHKHKYPGNMLLS